MTDYERRRPDYPVAALYVGRWSPRPTPGGRCLAAESIREGLFSFCL